jgi:hypothetical protein
MQKARHPDSALLEDANAVENTTLRVHLPWPAEKPRFRVTVVLRDVGDEFECVGLQVTTLSQQAGVGAVGSALLRQLPVGRLIRDAIRQLLETLLNEAEREVVMPSARAIDQDFARKQHAFWQDRRDGLISRLAEPTGQGTGRRYPPGHLQDVAAIARSAKRAGESMRGQVAEAFGITPSAAANQISRARMEGLLDDGMENQ